MICEICLNYEGDSEDDLIKFICGSIHHPNCPNFKIDKDLFLSELKRQVDKHANMAILTNLPQLKDALEDGKPEIKKDRVSNKIIRRLYNYLWSRYFPIVPNSYIYDWESDLLAVNKEIKYITEYEIKISRNDFKCDFLKLGKHELIKDCYKYKFSSDIPNYFYYATTPGLLDKSEIPNYSGLIEIGNGIRIVKRAPLLHKEIIDEITIDKLLKKVYYKYWNKI